MSQEEALEHLKEHRRWLLNSERTAYDICSWMGSAFGYCPHLFYEKDGKLVFELVGDEDEESIRKPGEIDVGIWQRTAFYVLGFIEARVREGKKRTYQEYLEETRPLSDKYPEYPKLSSFLRNSVVNRKCDICDDKGFYHKEWGRSLVPTSCPKCNQQQEN